MSRAIDQEVLRIHEKLIESMVKVEELLVKQADSAGLDSQQKFLFISRTINLVFQRHYNMCMETVKKDLEVIENENKN